MSRPRAGRDGEQREEVVLGSGIHVERHSPTRVTFHVLKEVWHGLVEVARVEVDVAKHLDPRVSITVQRLDERSAGPVEVTMR